MNDQPEPKLFHLHLVSDATGETIISVARACLAQFEDVVPVEHFWNLVRTDRQLDFIFEDIEKNPGLVIFTIVDDHLRRRLQDRCVQAGIPGISVLDPVIDVMTEYFGKQRRGRPGLQHELNAAYFSRMEAMDFAIAHDDGQGVGDYPKADVILVGVSRTSKTPVTLYLANRGILAANMPFVPDVPIPQEMLELSKPLIVGLTKDADQLVQVRRSRLTFLQQSDQTSYVDPEKVREELQSARRLFAKNGWPVIDVSRRAIEETAAEVVGMLNRRRQQIAQERANQEKADQDEAPTTSG